MKSLKQVYIPTIEEMQCWYEDNLRREALKSSEYYYKCQLISDIETQHQQRLVTVPYVVKAKQKVIDSLNLGVPVYIVGHLGSGKTQLVTEAALYFKKFWYYGIYRY